MINVIFIFVYLNFFNSCCCSGEFILWNSQQVSLIYQADDFQNATTFREDQKLTNNSVLWEGVYYSKNLPTYLSFPMLGTQDIDTGDVNFLYLPTPTTLYMLKKEEWKGVDVNEWEFTGDEGNYLGTKVGNIKIYKKDYPSGRHRIDNKSALYLFDARGTVPQRARPAKRSKPLWGLSCGSGVPNRLQNPRKEDEDPRQKLMLHGIGRNKRCEWKTSKFEADESSAFLDNVKFTPGKCGYLCPTGNTDILSPQFPVRNQKPKAPENQSGLPPPPASPNAPLLPPIIDPLKRNGPIPILDPNPLQYLPSIGLDEDLGENNGWLGQGVINGEGKWMTENDNTDSDLFNIEDGEDILKRVWINAGGVIENIPLNMTENNKNDSSTTINKRVERQVEPTFISLGGRETNGVRDFFTGFQLSHNFGSNNHKIGQDNSPTSTIFKSWSSFGRRQEVEQEQNLFAKSVFIPLNWTFYLSCNDQGTSKLDTDPASCVFNPIPLSRAPPPSSLEYSLRLNRVLTPYGSFSTPIPDIGPSFEILSILEPHNSSIPIRCGQLPFSPSSDEGESQDGTTESPIDDTTVPNFSENENLVEKQEDITGNSGCRLHCLINLEEGNSALCNNSEVDDIDEESFFEDPFGDTNINFDTDTINKGKAGARCVDTKEWCRFVNCSLQEASTLCPATCQKCSSLCKDKAAWCKFVDCSIPEAATLCPSTCNTCGKKEPEATPETIEGDIIGRIVKNDDDHLLPNKVKILLGNWLLEGSDNWIYCGGSDRIFNRSLPSQQTNPNEPSIGTFSFDLKSLPQDIEDINNNLTLFIEEAGLDYPDLLLGESKILKGLVIGLYDDQECDDIIIERRPWESVKSGPSGEIAISSRYAIFYRKGSLDDIDATDNFGDKDSVKSLYPPCHWIFDIPEGISCARGEPARPGCQNFGSPTIFVPVDCSEVTLKIASKECEEDIGGRNRASNLAQERPDCYNIVDWS